MSRQVGGLVSRPLSYHWWEDENCWVGAISSPKTIIKSRDKNTPKVLREGCGALMTKKPSN